MENPVLRIGRLVTGYAAGRHRTVIAQGLSASLAEASVTALIGPNGAGKSTLLRTVASLQPALGGDISWLGRPLADYSVRELARVIAVVLTTRPAAEGLTARQVVELGRLPYTGFGGRLTEKDHAVVDDVMSLTETAAFAPRPLASLSDGERQRVMIAKALAQQTPAILLDEPTAFLDFPGKVGLLRLLCDLAQRCGKTILLSTHDLELTFQMVGRLWLLSSEGIIEGTPRELAGNGSLGHFFTAPGVSFDAAALKFSVSATS